MIGGLLDDDALHVSAVVANRAMNRERQLVGVNSYARELGFSPLDWLVTRVRRGSDGAGRVGWLDLCCGSGRALIQAGEQVAATGLAGRVALVGVDLVDYFDPAPPVRGAPELVCASVTGWRPPRPFDLITCVHGLHYIGDKLRLLALAVSWLTDTGLFIADLDLTAIRLPDRRPAGRRLSTALRAAGLSYDPRRHRVTCTGRRILDLPYRYLGADDHTGPNYTGQPAVHSIYGEREDRTAPAGGC